MKYTSFLLTLVFLLSGFSSYAQPSKTDAAPKGYQIGSTVEDFNMKNVDGKFYSLASIEDVKGYIVIFTSNVCPYAVTAEDRIIALHNLMAPKGYPVVATTKL